MIENKLVIIKRRNTFDKGWTLVAPYHAVFPKNKHFHALNVSDIVRAITKSTRVNLILSEPCLSSQIVKELEWVNQYISINLIAKNSAVEKRYAKLKFNSVEMDENIDFNYIAVTGSTDLFALIAEDYISADKSLNEVYFENAKANASYEFLTEASSIVFVDENNDREYDELFKACLNAKVPTAYLIGAKAYKRESVHEFIDLPSRLLCSKNVRNGILYSSKDGKESIFPSK